MTNRVKDNTGQTRTEIRHPDNRKDLTGVSQSSRTSLWHLGTRQLVGYGSNSDHSMFYLTLAVFLNDLSQHFQIRDFPSHFQLLLGYQTLWHLDLSPLFWKSQPGSHWTGPLGLPLPLPLKSGPRFTSLHTCLAQDLVHKSLSLMLT